MKKEFVFGHDYNPVLHPEAKAALSGKKGKVLNIACEFDLIPEFLKGLADPRDVYGAEINEEVVKNNPNVRLCDVEQNPLPFEAGTLDLVLSIWGIEHFQSDNIIKETHRVLNAKGQMLLLTPNIVNPLFSFSTKSPKGWLQRLF